MIWLSSAMLQTLTAMRCQAPPSPCSVRNRFILSRLVSFSISPIYEKLTNWTQFFCENFGKCYTSGLSFVIHFHNHNSVYLSRNCLFLNLLHVLLLHYNTSISVFFISSQWKHFYSLFARLNWKLACQFSSANHLSYHIIFPYMPT